MAAHSDHIRRDAEHAARCEISIVIFKYIRRINAEAYAHIAQAIAGYDGELADGTAIGREAAHAAIAGYLGLEDVQPAIEATGHHAEGDGDS